MNPETLTPLPEVCYRSDRVRFNIPFPSWVEMDRIGVNLPRTERLMNIGGITHVRVRGTTDNSTVSHLVPLGIAPDGSSYAGKVSAVEKVPAYNIESHNERGIFYFRNQEWTTIGINLNLKEIQERITNKNGNVRYAESWVPHLDNTIRSGIREAGTKHLLKNLSLGQKLAALFVNIHCGFMDAANISLFSFLTHATPRIPSIEQLTFSLTFNFVFLTLWMSAATGFEKKSGGGYRVSFFPGYEIDRAAMLQLLARTMPLVAPIGKNSNAR